MIRLLSIGVAGAAAHQRLTVIDDINEEIDPFD